MATAAAGRIGTSEMIALSRWNTPTIYNGWEQITKHSNTDSANIFNEEETVDFMPEMRQMVGRAVTMVIEPSNPEHKKTNPNAWEEFRRYLATAFPGEPKIVVVQDLDKPRVVGSAWGEVTANTSMVLGCVGTITDGAIRDLDEMKTAGFHAIARRLCVGHAHATPVRWGCPVQVFGTTVHPGTLMHADKHGFMAIPPEDEAALLEASIFMDQNECNTVLRAAKEARGLPLDQIPSKIAAAGAAFAAAAHAKFSRSGEW